MLDSKKLSSELSEKITINTLIELMGENEKNGFYYKGDFIKIDKVERDDLFKIYENYVKYLRNERETIGIPSYLIAEKDFFINPQKGEIYVDNDIYISSLRIPVYARYLFMKVRKPFYPLALLKKKAVDPYMIFYHFSKYNRWAKLSTIILENLNESIKYSDLKMFIKGEITTWEMFINNDVDLENVITIPDTDFDFQQFVYDRIIHLYLSEPTSSLPDISSFLRKLEQENFVDKKVIVSNITRAFLNPSSPTFIYSMIIRIIINTLAETEGKQREKFLSIVGSYSISLIARNIIELSKYIKYLSEKNEDISLLQEEDVVKSSVIDMVSFIKAIVPLAEQEIFFTVLLDTIKHFDYIDSQIRDLIISLIIDYYGNIGDQEIQEEIEL